MPNPLPRIRMELDFLPSPVEDRPGLMIRDPFGFSDATLIIPPPLVRGLTCFDGEHDQTNLRDVIYEATGELRSGEFGEQMHQALDAAGFLETERFEQIRDSAVKEFETSEVRAPAHAGTAYPDEPEELRAWMDAGMDGAARRNEALVGIAAPHASPDAGWESYRTAYGLLGDWAKDKTFVILGTSHYGEPDTFGLTRKPFVTPWGAARTELGLVDELERRAPQSIRMEDYAHRIEHSVEFQVVFLQSLFGADVKVLPVLVGSFGQSMAFPIITPEKVERVGMFLDVLGDIRAREGKKLVFVMGVDMAHMGRRYGDEFGVAPYAGEMTDVERRDRERLARLEAGDADGFWDLVRENRDPLKWCGTAPFYAFLKSAGPVKGRLCHYQHWDIDDQSVVTFGAMAFS